MDALQKALFKNYIDTLECLSVNVWQYTSNLDSAITRFKPMLEWLSNPIEDPSLEKHRLWTLDQANATLNRFKKFIQQEK